jgi:phosphatidylglycerophosphatase C
VSQADLARVVRPLLERLDAEFFPGAALAFDGDGTLWSGDVGEDVFEYAIKHHLFRAEGAEALCELATRIGIEPLATASATAVRLLTAYRQHRMPELAACEMMTFAFAGYEPLELRMLVDHILHQADLNARRFEPLHHVLDWGRSRNLRVIVVSASPNFVIEQAVAALGVSAPDIAACTLAIDSTGRLSRMLARPCPYAHEKVRAAEAILNGAPLLAAFGDSGFDFELLRAARVPVSVRPKPSLHARFGELAPSFTFENDGSLVQLR